LALAKKLSPPAKQTARLAIEKRRKGKVVTIISGLTAYDNDLPALLKRLKNQCGAGGTLEGETLEIQGDHLKRLCTLLGEMGYRVK
jgi:translation initiation factor 1